MTQETPIEVGRVHGRLLESAHIAGYTFKRAWDELKWLLANERWKQLGFSDGGSFAESIYGLFSEFKGTVEQRKEVATALAGIASQRAIAKVLGVSDVQVGRDLGKYSATNVARDASEPAEINAIHDLGATNVAAFALDVDPYKLAKRQERQTQKHNEALERSAKISESNLALPITDRKYSVIYADPPWNFEAWSGKGDGRAAKYHYPTMNLKDIEDLPVEALAAEDCALFIWVLMPMLHNAFDVIKAWGFEFKTCAFVWIKQNTDGNGIFTGLGMWTRANAELCLLATRGSPKRLSADVHQVILSPRTEHSRKPEEAASRIEQLVPGPYLEMFSRAPRGGWDAWGNQENKFAEAV